MSAPLGKVLELDALARCLDLARAHARSIVHCHGVFDLLHIGHIRHLEEARRMGDVLVVTITPDRFVNKGPNRPAFPEALRAEALAALTSVDHVAVNQWPTAVETIQLLRPDVYVKGVEYRDATRDVTGKISEEEAAVLAVGGRIEFTDDIVFSSSTLLRDHMSAFPPEARDYLKVLAERFPPGKVIDYLERARGLKVLVVGEAIIDEYRYCRVIGKSTKEPILAALADSVERYAGGILAVANHVAGFCDQVTMLTMLGEASPEEAFVRDGIRSNVRPIFVTKRGAPTIVKRRYVESYLLQKLFEVYEMDETELCAEEEAELCERLSAVLPEHDVVIVVDYGHGMLTRNAIERLCAGARFLALNVQANAGNRGFNTVSRYPHADFVSLARHEVQLELRNRWGELRDYIVELSERVRAGCVQITCGKDGCVAYHVRDGFTEAPALSAKVVDRIGAGDAVLSVTSLCVALGAPTEVVGFVGNAVGALAVLTMGNRDPVDRVTLYKLIESALK